MKGAPIRIIDQQFQLQAEIEDYESLLFSRRYDIYGSFELQINQNKHHVEHLKKGAILFLSPEKAGVIHYREMTLDKDGKKSQTLTIRGYTLEHLLTYRITQPATGKESYEAAGKAEDIVKGLISYNLGTTCVNKNRIITEIEINPSKGQGNQTAVSTRYLPLDEECQRILSPSGLGLKIMLDYARKKYVVDVYEGRNLTTQQSIHPPVIFSEEFDNIASRSVVDSLLGYKNTAVVSGQVKGMEPETVLLNDTNKGLDRREVFLEAGNLERDSAVTLTDRGKEGLLNYKPIYTLEGTVIPYASFRYGQDYALGDVVTVRYRDGEQQLYMNTRIVEVTESYDKDGFHLEVIFGDKVPTVIDKLKQIASAKR